MRSKCGRNSYTAQWTAVHLPISGPLPVFTTGHPLLTDCSPGSTCGAFSFVLVSCQRKPAGVEEKGSLIPSVMGNAAKLKPSPIFYRAAN
ncbi:hypothetical protein AAHC03_026738 [Spirometra sp. Aus1]